MRHAKPAATWGAEADPGLDAAGVEQAASAARHLAGSLARLPVYTSPMRRCRETAEPLCKLWSCEASVLPVVSEIPAPPGDAAARRDWLIEAMRGTWRDIHANALTGPVDYLAWRHSVLDGLRALSHDCVIYTHYVAINVAVGAAQERDDVICFRPDHASVTVLAVDRHGLRLVELGREAETAVLSGSRQ
ncbi:MAG: histidine phosphatase family protein [Steroidobacteraceae bacterium]